MLIHLLLTLLLGGMMPEGQSPSPRPDFSGVWDQDSDASKALTEKNGGEWRVAGAGVGGPPPAGSGVRVLRPETVITQSATELVIERRFEGEITGRDVYKLDGSESLNVSRTSTSKSTTTWQGRSLVTKGSTHIDLSDQARDVNGNPIKAIDRTFVTIRTLMADGTMVTESRSTQNGQERISWSVHRRRKS